MNSFTYYTNDGYFNDIITGFFDKKDNWKKTQNDISQVTFMLKITQYLYLIYQKHIVLKLIIF